MTMAELAAFYYRPWVLFIWGACWGSFLNVVIYRFPLGQSVISPPSACPNCGKQIAAYDNIPVLSWFLLRGKCRNCKQGFSIRYAMFEAGLGSICAFAVVFHPNNPAAALSLGHGLLALIPTLWIWWCHRKAPWYLVLIAITLLPLYLILIFNG